MRDDSLQALWQLGDEVWSQDPASGSFRLDEVAAREVDAGRLADIDLALGAHLKVAGCQRAACAYYPRAFSFCPNCGERFPPAPSPLPEWLPPYGSRAHFGLKVTDFDLALADASELPEPEQRLPLPGNGVFEFAVGGFGAPRQRLLAINRLGGLALWSPQRREWLRLEADGIALGESTLESWEWSAAIPGSAIGSRGLYLPTDAGAGWVDIDQLRLSYSVTRDAGRALGGAAAIGEVMALPALLPDGVHVLLRSAVRSGAPAAASSLPVRALAAFDASGIDPAALRFGVPIVDSDRQRIYWIGNKGQIVLEAHGSSSAGFRASWLGWPGLSENDIVCTHYGPPHRDARGQYWQLCFDDDLDPQKKTYRFITVGPNPQTRAVSQPRLASGALTYHRGRIYRSGPWDDNHDYLGRECLILPLLETASTDTFVAAEIDYRGTPMTLFKSNQRYLADFRIIGRSNQHVHRVGALPQPWETRVFVYEKCLFLYHPQHPERAILGWKLAD